MHPCLGHSPPTGFFSGYGYVSHMDWISMIWISIFTATLHNLPIVSSPLPLTSAAIPRSVPTPPVEEPSLSCIHQTRQCRMPSYR